MSTHRVGSFDGDLTGTLQGSCRWLSLPDATGSARAMNPTSRVEASVIIPAFNAAQVLPDQLRALCRQVNAPAFEVIVVANRCTDATFPVAAAFSEALDLRVFRAEELASAAYARNFGAARALGRFLLFCDADDEVGPSWVAAMTAAVSSGHADFVAGQIRVDRERVPAWLYRWRSRYLDGTCVQEQHQLLPYVITASMAVSAAAFREVGGFDESFPGSAGEDCDFSWRLLRSGYRMGEAPAAIILYRPRGSLSEALAQTRAYSRALVVLRHRSGPPSEPRSGWALIKEVTRVLGHSAVSQGEWHPLFLYGRARQRYDLWREEKRFLATGVGEPAPNLDHAADFMVPLTTPILGGLALAADGAAAADGHHRDGVGSVALGVLEKYLPHDGVLVDIGANIGIFSVAAAKLVGEGGHVVAFEPNSLTRSVLHRNLARHRVAPIVEVFPDGPEDCGAEVGPSAALRGRQLVEVVRVAETLQRRVDVIRIGAGPYEWEVLGETEELLGRNSQMVLLVDLDPDVLTAAGTSADEVLERLPENRWDLWVTDQNSEWQVDPLQRLDRAAWPRNADSGASRRFTIVAIQKDSTRAQLPA